MSRQVVSHGDGHVYEFSPEIPVYTAADGESLTVETIDSLDGGIQTDDDRLDSIPEEVNAATGPIAADDGTVVGMVSTTDAIGRLESTSTLA